MWKITLIIIITNNIDKICKVTLVPSFILILIYWVAIYGNLELKRYIYNTLTVSYEESKILSFASSIMKRIVASWSTVPVNLICCTAFESASNAYCLLKSTVYLNLSFNVLWNRVNLVNSHLCNHLLD